MTGTQVAAERRRGMRVVLAVVVLGLAAMWVYVLFIGKESSPNQLGDRTWAERAEPVCAAVALKIGALPPARSFAAIEPIEEALRQRAAVGQQATDLLAGQLSTLRALPAPTGGTDGKLLDAWFADWDTYLADRQDHIEDWRAGRDRAFAETEADTGGPISDRMDALATQNRMPSCVVPGDFG
jgi:hypothetical protein